MTQRFNRLLVGLRGTVDRTVYEDAHLTNGKILDQSDRDSTSTACACGSATSSPPG